MMSVFSEPVFWICLAMGYLIGSIPFGFLAGKMRGVDIREHGSGNIGATNVLRTLGKPIGLTVFILDVLKGAVPVFIAMALSENTLVHVATAIATILGHNFTIFLKFKGGKGIATTAGTMLPLVPIALVVAIACWIILFKATRYVSVGSIAAAISIPMVEWIRSAVEGTWEWPVLIYTLILSVLAVWKHRENIKRLMKGEESKFEKKKKEAGT